MQSLSTLSVFTLSAGIIHLVLFHNSVRIDGLPQLTRVRVVSIVTVTHHHFNITVFVACLSCLLLVASTIGLAVESNRSYGVNRIEIIFGERSALLCTRCVSNKNNRIVNNLLFLAVIYRTSRTTSFINISPFTSQP